MEQAGPNRPTRIKCKPTWLTDFVYKVRDKDHLLSNDSTEQTKSKVVKFCKNFGVIAEMESARPKSKV